MKPRFAWDGKAMLYDIQKFYDINISTNEVTILGQVTLSFKEIEEICREMKRAKKTWTCTARSKAGCREDCDNELCSIHIFKNKPIIE
jgi:hypothetical protein